MNIDTWFIAFRDWVRTYIFNESDYTVLELITMFADRHPAAASIKEQLYQRALRGA